MHVASVTLDEVLRAAAARAAALVPETAGYLALAIGDASARLPYRLEDGLVTLTTEGTVRVARGRETVAPEESARVLRDTLRRLLSVSAGTMPGLATAAGPRSERGGPDSVIAEVEAALIPVNRAAARRSLARLARDASRARDAGRLAPIAPALAAAPAPPAPAVAPALPPQPAPAAPPVVVLATPAPLPVFEVEVEYEPETPFQPALAVPRHVPEPEEVTHRIELPEPTHVDAVALACEVDPDVLELASATDVEAIAAVHLASPRPPTPRPPARVVSWVDPDASAPVAPPAVPPAAPLPAPAVAGSATLAIDAAAKSLAESLLHGRLVAAQPAAIRRLAPRRPAWQAQLADASQSDVDTLLASFGPSDRPADRASDATAMRRDLKKLVGIDATQLPPRAAMGPRDR